MVSALDLQAEGCGFKTGKSQEEFQTISTPSCVEYKVDREVLGESQWHQMCMGDL